MCDQRVPTGVVGWFPLRSANSLSWPHKLSYMKAIEGAVRNGLPLEKYFILRTLGDQVEVVDSLEALLPGCLEGIEVSLR